MKKFSFLSIALLLLMAAFSFSACQKDQSPVADQTTGNSVAGETNSISAVQGYGASTFAGSIAPTYAESLAANYADKYDDRDQAQYVEFSSKDLAGFIANMRARGSTSIFVNFGVYGKGAKPDQSKDWGRLTVFFTGQKPTIKSPSSDRRNFAVQDLSTDDFLNHGTIYP
jgi:hypothetical protein